MEDIIKASPAGWVVRPNQRVKLPGVFLTHLSAERAYNAYLSAASEAASKREKKKG